MLLFLTWDLKSLKNKSEHCYMFIKKNAFNQNVENINNSFPY